MPADRLDPNEVERPTESAFTTDENVVFGEAHGVGLLMDIFTPTGPPNGLGIIDVISGTWLSSRAKLKSHASAQVFQSLAKRGFTTFAVRPGSRTKFSISEMQRQLNQGIRWVKQHAAQFQVDPSRLGMLGFSSGGHLASLSAVTDEEAVERSGVNHRVQAVAAFFPPTDFLQYGNTSTDPLAKEQARQLMLQVTAPHGPSLSPDEFDQLLFQLSPARHVTSQAPPFLLIHGDADQVVPLQQSEVMLHALQAAGVPSELIVKPGEGHLWPTIHEEVQLVADWFAKTLNSSR